MAPSTTLPFIALLPFSVVVCCVAVEREVIERDTELGHIRGYSELFRNNKVQSFLGIPYALPPIDDRRFRAPETFGSWSGTLNATALPNSCPQVVDHEADFEGLTMWNPNTKLDEDCLYLNVWTPNEDPDDSEGLPVMVWIYGGGFSTGTSTLPLYDGRILAAMGDVVVVSMQYRVGVLGFLSSGTADFPGNYGLLDQAMALQWVKDNIACYGGDPERVTLFGESAGAVSVGFHLLSPLSQDLFQQAILESTGPETYWAVDTPAKSMEVFSELTDTIGCSGSNMAEVQRCLVDIPVDTILDKTKYVNPYDNNGFGMPARPSVDGTFLPQTPKEIIDSQAFKKTNILLGINANEGAYFLPYSIPDVYSKDGARIANHETFVDSVAKLVDGESNELLTNAVVFEYSKSYHYRQEPDYAQLLDLILGDMSFSCPVVNFAKTYASSEQSVYFYLFDQDLSSNPWPDWMGVLHGYEIDPIFGHGLNESLTEYNQNERDFTKRVLLHWTNFAKNGDPSITAGQTATPYDWPAYTMDNRNVLVLNSTSPAVTVDGLKDRECEFWTNMAPALREGHTNGATNINLQLSTMISVAILSTTWKLLT